MSQSSLISLPVDDWLISMAKYVNKLIILVVIILVVKLFDCLDGDYMFFNCGQECTAGHNISAATSV